MFMTIERIAYVVNVFPKLSETFIAQELAELNRRRIEVRVLSLNRPTETIRHAFVSQTGLTDLTTYGTGEFGSIAADFRPQLIHAHFATEPTAVARQLASSLNVPFTFTAHGYDIYRRPPDDFARRAASAHAVITVSRANAWHIARTFGVSRRHIRVIPSGVDIQRFRPDTAAANPLCIVCVARLVPVKNLYLLLAACAELRMHGRDFQCVVIGDGPCRTELLAERDRLELQQSVEFIGAADQATVLAWWQRAAIAVLTSDREGMPVSLIEAAACGVPGVATAVGGVPELIEHGVTGLLAEPGNSRSLARSLEYLLGDEPRRTAMGIAARHRAEQRFSIQMQVDRLCELWNAVA
jgi:glycosyltransferase involved in cell wall biosynthesis